CQGKSWRLFWRRETQRSGPPQPPGRILPKYIKWPSGEKVGLPVLPIVLLMTGPRLRGGSHSASRSARWETQLSRNWPPLTPPGRTEVMYRLNPFLETTGKRSSYIELTTGPRLTGVDQRPNGPSRSSSSSSLDTANTAVGRKLAATPSAPAPCRSRRRGTSLRALILATGFCWRREYI